MGIEANEVHKVCKNCLLEKPITMFHIDKNGYLGRKRICRNCISKIGSIKRINKHLKPVDLPNEIWMDIKGYEGVFAVSNLGRVKSLHYSYVKDGKTRTKFEKILSQKINDYYVVTVTYKSKSHTITVHRELAKCFIPNPENKPCVNHIDGNKLNNSIGNLEWVTFQENTIHGIKNGLIKNRGADCHWAKLSESDAIQIYNSKESAKQLSEKYKVGDEAIYSIKKGKNWGHITKQIL